MDTTSFIERCRAAIEDGVSKNIGLAEKMLDLLGEWQSNNENMKTIAPTLLQTVETMNNATRDQIADVAYVNDVNENRSNELNSELAAVGDTIKQHTETNRNEITRIIGSVNNHTELFSVSLKSSKAEVLEQFEMQKNLTTAKFKNVESNIVDGFTNVLSNAANIVYDIKVEDSHVKDDFKNHVNTNSTLKTIVKKFGASSMEKLSNWRNVLTNFHKNELKTYTSSG